MQCRFVYLAYSRRSFFRFSSDKIAFNSVEFGRKLNLVKKNRKSCTAAPLYFLNTFQSILSTHVSGISFVLPYGKMKNTEYNTLDIF